MCHKILTYRTEDCFDLLVTFIKIYIFLNSIKKNEFLHTHIKIITK